MNLSRHRDLIWFGLLFSALLHPLASTAQNQSAPSLQKLLKSPDKNLQTEWAARYEHGEGVNQNYRHAIRLYCAAARKGNVAAQYQLGWLYANGRGGIKDEALAAAWFRRAAKRGDDHAAQILQHLASQPKRKARCKLPLPANSTDLATVGTAQRRQIVNWVKQLAPDYELDPQLVLAVIAIESNFNNKALSPKNAQGLMQLIPATARRFGVKNAFDPVDNLHGGMAYLRWLLAYFKSDLKLALAAYNAGEKAVERYNGIPPYRETQNYVAKITALYGKDQHPLVSFVVEPSPIVQFRNVNLVN